MKFYLVCVYTCGGQKWTLVVLLHCSLHYFLRLGLLLNLETSISSEVIKPRNSLIFVSLVLGKKGTHSMPDS